MASNGSFNTSSYKNLSLLFSWEIKSQSIENNTTTISWSLKGHRTDGATGYITCGGFKVVINGKIVYSKSTDYRVDVYNGTVIASGTETISHNSDGTKSFSASAEGAIYYSTVNSSGEGTWTLTTIPRASTISATDANVGSVSSVIVNRKSNSFTHSIKYTFGSLTGYITSSGGVSGTEQKLSSNTIGWTIPTTFYAQLPTAKSATCKLTCKTYSGNTQIGAEQTCTFKVSTTGASAPSVSGTVQDTNDATIALTGSSDKLVRFFSTVLCTITAAAKNSATIQSKAIAGQSVTGNTRTISNVETGGFSFSATDSRGYSTSVTVTKDLIPYVKLTCNVSAYRPQPTDGSGRIKLSGNYYNGSFGAVSNALTLQYRLQGSDSWIDISPTITDNTYIAYVNLTDLDYQTTYTYQVRAIDKLTSIEKSDDATTIRPGIPVFDWGKDDFAFHVPVKSDKPFNGVYMASGGNLYGFTSILVQSMFSNFSGDGGTRQSIFLFGLANSSPVHGLAKIKNNGNAEWSGTGTLTFTHNANGQVTITLPEKAYDFFVLISAYPFSIVSTS